LRGSAAGAPAGRTALWQEKQLTMSGKASYTPSADHVRLENLRIASDALTLHAAGDIKGLGAKADLNLQGQVDCDWSRLAKLLTPYVGDSVRMEGRDKREFAVRGPIRGLLDGNLAANDAHGVGQKSDPFLWIKPLTAQASVGWQRAEAYGLQIGKGEIVGNLREGLVKTNPIELAVSDGRLRLAPQVLLTPAPAELVHGQAKVIERVKVTPQMTATWLKFIAPALAEATETRGELSLDLTGAKVPLFTPQTASAVGRLDIHTLQVTPGPPARAVILLAEQIRALVERRPPPAELSRNPTLLAIDDQQIDFRMAGGRVVHQGMTMNVGDVTIRTSGWVAFDETIGLVAEIPIKAEWVQKTPALASMQGQTLQIPIGGTLRRPQIDPRAWQQVLSIFAQGAARGLIEDQLNRLLEPR
jgi:translocation and assembly module TamB